MHCSTRLLQSRSNWRAKATERNKTISKLYKQLGRRDLQVDRLAKMNASLSAALKDEKARTAALMSAPERVLDIGNAATIRALCVLLVVQAVVSFRSVPRILRLISSCGLAELSWIPSFTSVINWTLRLGLAQLSSVSKMAESWVAIIDCSIDVSVKKVLVVLRVKLSALSEIGSALSLEDCELIGIEVAASWCGKRVAAALDRIFDIAGLPAAIIKDCGTDLNLGVRLWKEQNNAKSVWTINDIGHVMANALKAAFSERKAFTDFLALVKSAGAKLRQSDLSFLAPPKVRTKGRFQSIMTLADWGARMLKLLGGSGRQKEGSMAERLRRFIPHFGGYRTFLEAFSKTSIAASEVLAILKNKGLNRTTYHEVRTLLEDLPPRSKVRKKLMHWLDNHLHIHCRLGIGQMALPVSSDIIESLMGKFKVVLQRNPKAEFNRILLAMPALCGLHTEKSVQRALATVSHTDLLRWEEKNVDCSQLKKRRKFLSKKVPKTVRAMWL